MILPETKKALKQQFFKIQYFRFTWDFMGSVTMQLFSSGCSHKFIKKSICYEPSETPRKAAVVLTNWATFFTPLAKETFIEVFNTLYIHEQCIFLTLPSYIALSRSLCSKAAKLNTELSHNTKLKTWPPAGDLP